METNEKKKTGVRRRRRDLPHLRQSHASCRFSKREVRRFQERLELSNRLWLSEKIAWALSTMDLTTALCKVAVFES